MKDNNSFLKPQKAAAQHWLSLSLGRTGFYISALLNTRDNKIAVEVIISNQDANVFYHKLLEQKTSIEQQIGNSLVWKELPTKKSSRILLYKANTSPTNTDDWNNQHQWFKENLELFYRVFSPIIKML